MVPVKSVKEYDCQLDIAVLFSETLDRFVIYFFPLKISFTNIWKLLEDSIFILNNLSDSLKLRFAQIIGFSNI